MQVTKWMNCAERLKQQKEDDSKDDKTVVTNVTENVDATAFDENVDSKNSCKLQ